MKSGSTFEALRNKSAELAEMAKVTGYVVLCLVRLPSIMREEIKMSDDDYMRRLESESVQKQGMNQSPFEPTVVVGATELLQHIPGYVTKSIRNLGAVAASTSLAKRGSRAVSRMFWANDQATQDRRSALESLFRK